ncbi:hypothetical protein FSPOR_9527 [Fusarium sporotrichioides]|uniref:Uncharacterized protein n=1 Tax=Fusarium sporotrichioides TaxID=5514 RepID=A0A395RQM0_FUSSP|nr:hypothetical protein FSPOR_9527 [Fusarium sporotrichioides]
MMSSVNPFTPVTPPPESLSFPKLPTQRPSQNNLKRKASSQDPFSDLAGLNAPTMMAPPPPPTSQPRTSSSPNLSSGPSSTNTPQSSGATTPEIPNIPGANLDPKYLAMVSRIAAYYQQRCQAVANYQQQRCQAWANMHRQKCQDMMQASMLVVAWYVRDRIQRRRRREKRQFRHGLKRRTDQNKIAKTEVVRRWVKQIPEGQEAPSNPIDTQLADREEAEFSMDRETQPDKDTKLFDMADNLIKSQYKKIEVPIMGVLNFDESDNESESDLDEPEQYEEMDEAEDLVEDDEYYEVEDDELYDDEDEIEYIGDGASQVVHHGTGTGTGSRNNNHSESS